VWAVCSSSVVFSTGLVRNAARNGLLRRAAQGHWVAQAVFSSLAKRLFNSHFFFGILHLVLKLIQACSQVPFKDGEEGDGAAGQQAHSCLE